jgi:hypothetical protein
MTLTSSTSNPQLGRVNRVRVAVAGAALLGGALVVGVGFTQRKR